MFATQAHSFQQQARLAISLSWIAGYTNALTILTCGQVTSHLTGVVSQLGVEVAELRWTATGYLLGLLGMFLCGAFVSGALVEIGRLRRLQSIYVMPMLVEAALLGLFALLVDWQARNTLDPASARVWLTFLPAFAMGLQNATITRISGGVVRTTHVTGVVTDLGLELSKLTFRGLGRGRRLLPQRAAQDVWRALMLASILASFALGASLGTLAFDFIEAWSMVPAVAFLALLTLVDMWRPIATVELRPGTQAGPPVMAIYHAEPPAHGRHFRMPDLATWAACVADHVHVVVLDLANLGAMGERSALELRALMLHLREEGRHLVLAGVGREQLAVMHSAGVLLDFDTDDLCLDLAAAALRGERLAPILATPL